MILCGIYQSDAPLSELGSGKYYLWYIVNNWIIDCYFLWKSKPNGILATNRQQKLKNSPILKSLIDW